ncbi:MAG: DnaJ domain-containing protein [Hyphomonadaceae bacterium]|nr:DnaJ domain-containing protein [Hyphomonadaceae bacterium]
MLGAVLLFITLLFAALFIGRYAAARRHFVSRYAAVILLLVAAILTVIRGQTLLGALLGIGAAALYLFTDRPRRASRGNSERSNGRMHGQANERPHQGRSEGRQSGNPSVNGGSMSDSQARAILGVHPGATETEIRAAFRRRIQTAHPDHGGTNEEAARLSAARDVLLRR